ncbi:hypothetical protein [Hansschlegelia zhihuaiae]|uniref:Uncharacterized protein n=1 Tax=Hansschlegelia zhihuaiae TaxID=405005 RepID=A0A4Q0ML02_9HYPH|nr:hypothetical protein [Hansschlegelia zhihuaiae]RXF74318.1 hypothetical protein EK403_05695 [Hansschlegelia zhihuaiae]
MAGKSIVAGTAAVGFTAGLLIGSMLVGSSLPPVATEPYLATYGSLIAAVAAVAVASALIWQILSSSAQHKSAMLTAKERSQAEWEAADGELAVLAERVAADLSPRIEAMLERNPDLAPALEAGEAPASISFPEMCRFALEPPNHTAVLTSRSSPNTARQFFKMIDELRKLLGIIAPYQIALPPEENRNVVGRLGAEYVQVARHVLSLCAKVRVEAERWRPR